MWIGKKVAQTREKESDAQVGVVTVGGTSPAVTTDGERRQLQVACPGGFWWRPSSEDSVLVVDGAVAGCFADCPVTLSAGEIYLAGGGCSIYFRSTGRVDISGEVYLNDEKLEV